MSVKLAVFVASSLSRTPDAVPFRAVYRTRLGPSPMAEKNAKRASLSMESDPRNWPALSSPSGTSSSSRISTRFRRRMSSSSSSTLRSSPPTRTPAARISSTLTSGSVSSTAMRLVSLAPTTNWCAVSHAREVIPPKSGAALRSCSALTWRKTRPVRSCSNRPSGAAVQMVRELGLMAKSYS